MSKYAITVYKSMTTYKVILGISGAIGSLALMAFVLIVMLINKEFDVGLSIVLVVVPIGAFMIIISIIFREKEQEDRQRDRYTSNTSE